MNEADLAMLASLRRKYAETLQALAELDRRIRDIEHPDRPFAYICRREDFDS